QNADKYLIAKEMERKAIQNITREVIYSYWQTLAADQLLAEIYPLMDRVNIALEDFEYIEELLLSSPMDALLYQKELLDVAQILLSQQRSLMSSRTELSTLMGLLPGTEYKLIKTKTPLTELKIDLETMEEAALFARPELMESRYLKRISSEEVRASMVSLMPTLQFNSTWNYNSNKYLLNKSNYEFGSQIGGNLLNIFKAPLTKKAAEASQTVIEEQRLALSMAVLSQVHLSNINYAQSMREYSNARHYLNVSERINEQIKNAQKISRFGELEVIREEASMLVAKLRHDIAYAELQYSLGTIYASIGMDFTPDNIGNFSEKDLASFINESLGRWSKKYYAEVAIPIDEQDPVFKKKSAVLTDIDYRRSINYNIPLDPYFSEFSFSPQTFYLSGPGKVRYRVREANGKPLPNWLVFIPTERKFIGTSPDEIESLEISIEASNDVVQVKELFELKFQKKRKPIVFYAGDVSMMDEELVITKNEGETLVIEKNVDSVTTKINQANTIAAVDEVKQVEINEEQMTLPLYVNADLQKKVDNLQIKQKPIPNKSVLMATLTDTLSSKLHAITAYKSDQAAFIQIGAFQSENVSNKVAEDISKKIGEKVIVEPTFITEPIYYRILVGPTHKDSVFEVITKLVDIGIKDYFLTSS
ncbi:TolC family protein, partial [Alphaproteobacteria bacterium]|nr:TolC family protein [Alphaproteobacteria bacterium]